MKRKLAIIFLVAILICFASVVNIQTVRAAETKSFDSTNVLEDLRSATSNGKEFKLRDYPLDAGGKISIINFVEFAYSYRKSAQTDTGLYIYVYNPQAVNFNASSAMNKIQLAVAYNADGAPSDYEKFDLVFCNKSEESDYKNLFYKFRIVDKKSADSKTILERVNSNQRRYDISGIEIVLPGLKNATEFNVGRTYYFTGYAKGCGPDKNAASTLRPAAFELETIELDLKHTFFRTGLSNKGVDHQNQLDTVYFAVDNEILETYGSLQRIKAEWWEYKTKEIVVTKNSDFYNSAKGYIGTNISDYIESINYELYSGFWVNATKCGADWGWNYGKKQYLVGGFDDIKVLSRLNTLYYLFKTDDIKAYDPYGSEKTVGGVSSNELAQYIYNYNKTYNGGKLPVKDRTISADLFLNNVDEGRTKGYNIREFDADIDIQQMLSYNSNSPSFWDKWQDFGFWNTIFGKLPQLDDSYIDIPPIYAPKDSDLQGATVDVAKRLLIRQEDIDDFKSFRNAAKKDNKTVFLFRFATTDYYSGALTIMKPKNFLIFDTTEVIKDEAYMAQESIFLDFDIIQLTFNKVGTYYVIPVVASPIDIINDITPPVWFPDGGCGSGCDGSFLKIILLILILILLIALWPAIRFVLRIVFYPVKLIFKKLKASFKKKKG